MCWLACNIRCFFKWFIDWYWIIIQNFFHYHFTSSNYNSLEQILSCIVSHIKSPWCSFQPWWIQNQSLKKDVLRCATFGFGWHIQLPCVEATNKDVEKLEKYLKHEALLQVYKTESCIGWHFGLHEEDWILHCL
jgi:hypothetical protein